MSKSDTGHLEYKDSVLKCYTFRRKFIKEFPDIMSLNFMEFSRLFIIDRSSKIKLRPNPETHVIRIIQKFSSAPANPNYHEYCKFELLRFKPWADHIHNALAEGQQADNEGWIESWQQFRDSEQGLLLIPRSSRVYEDAERAYEDEAENVTESEEESDEEPIEKANASDWQQVQMPTRYHVDAPINNGQVYTDADSLEYWKADRELFKEQLPFFPNWLNQQKLFPEFAEKDRSTRPIRHVDMSRLNIDQQVANNLFQHFINSDEQLLLRLEGCGGTGKSFLIEAWRQQVATIVLLAAPTGIAAHLIEGETLHSLLSLPTDDNFKELGIDKKRDREKKFKDVKLIIIDEYSMCGCKMMSRIDSRLRQISGRPQEPFGGYHVILVGDTLQLPPVGDTPLWYSLSTNEERTDENIAGLAAYRAFEKVVYLTIQVRQAGESQSVFRRILDNLRNGQSTLEDWQVLNTRMVNAYGPEERAALDHAICMFSRNKEVKDYNTQKLGELFASTGERTCRINAYHSSPAAQRIDADDFSGLEASLCIARGCKVMITANLWTQYGIVNGAIGHVRHIIFEEREGPTNLAQYVIVQMSNTYEGPELPGRPRYIVIEPKTAYTYVNGEK